MYLLTIYSETDAFIFRVQTIKKAVYIIENLEFKIIGINLIKVRQKQ